MEMRAPPNAVHVLASRQQSPSCLQLACQCGLGAESYPPPSHVPLWVRIASAAYSASRLYAQQRNMNEAANADSPHSHLQAEVDATVAIHRVRTEVPAVVMPELVMAVRAALQKQLWVNPADKQGHCKIPWERMHGSSLASAFRWKGLLRDTVLGQVHLARGYGRVVWLP